MSLIRSAAILVIAVLAGCSPQPCTNCPQVAGTYSQSGGSNMNDCGDHTIGLGDPSHPVTITQSGNQLTLNSIAFTNMPGELHDDSSAVFGPVPATLPEYDSSGDASGPLVPMHVYLDGWFITADGGETTFEGLYSATEDDDESCQVSNPITWTPQD